jgi:hypothetical protein
MRRAQAIEVQKQLSVLQLMEVQRPGLALHGLDPKYRGCQRRLCVGPGRGGALQKSGIREAAADHRR